MWIFNKYHLLVTYACGICMCKLQLWDTQKTKKNNNYTFLLPSLESDESCYRVHTLFLFLKGHYQLLQWFDLKQSRNRLNETISKFLLLQNTFNYHKMFSFRKSYLQQITCFLPVSMLYGRWNTSSWKTHSSQNSNDIISDIIKGASSKHYTNQGNVEVSSMTARTVINSQQIIKDFLKEKREICWESSDYDQ